MTDFYSFLPNIFYRKVKYLSDLLTREREKCRVSQGVIGIADKRFLGFLAA